MSELEGGRVEDRVADGCDDDHDDDYCRMFPSLLLQRKKWQRVLRLAHEGEVGDGENDDVDDESLRLDCNVADVGVDDTVYEA